MLVKKNPSLLPTETPSKNLNNARTNLSDENSNHHGLSKKFEFFIYFICLWHSPILHFDCHP
jgi:hypothetical protein